MLYDLEIVALSERVNQTLDFLRQDFSTLQFSTKSRMFVIFWGTLPQPLTDDEKALLMNYVEQKIIVNWRCKQQKPHGR